MLDLPDANNIVRGVLDGEFHWRGDMVPQPRRLSWSRDVLLWILNVVAALGLGFAGLAKFLQPERWQGLFGSWGYPPAFSFFVGAAEVVGAIALLVPRLSSYAAMLLGVVMVSALLTLLLHPGGALGWVATPCFYLVLLLIVGLYRWPRRLSAR